MDQIDPSIPQRMARVETGLQSLTDGQAELGRKIDKQGADFASSLSALYERNRWQWGPLIAFIALAVGLLGMWHTSNMALVAERFKETESQIGWSRTVNSLTAAFRQQQIQLLWRKVYNEDLPALNVVDIGPGHR